MVMLVFLQDREDAGRRRMTLLAGRAGRKPDPYAIAIDVHELVRNGNDDGHRTVGRRFRRPAEFARLQLEAFLRNRERREHTDSTAEGAGQDISAIDGHMHLTLSADSHIRSA